MRWCLVGISRKSTSYDRTLQIWDLENNQPLRTRGFRRQPGIPLPEPELITLVRPTPRFPLKFVINAG